MRAAAALLALLLPAAAAGARIVEHDIDDLLAAMNDATASAPLIAIEAAAVHADMHEPHAASYDRNVLARIRRGAGVSAAAYLRLMRMRQRLIADMDARLAPLDVLALPATATTAPPIAALEADDEAFMRANMLMLRNTTWGNLFDLTGISLPMPLAPRPAGLMLMKRKGHDRALLEVAAGVEGMLRG